ncbi:SUMF1/EgtB/PvdO family nonheme iron enzyme [Candidatus Falkowbacteria bacterium]|nr:SUMF1/EgtB/PvdO family nonheme iron enzyme [Candidatus Falkowbacteria bacterium]
MSQTINLKRKKKRLFTVGKREMLVVVSAILLSTVGIKAADRAFNDSSSSLAVPNCPDGMVKIAGTGLCIDQYEVSPGSYCLFKEPASGSDSEQDLNSSKCKPVSVKGAMPWRNISQNQAAEACAKAGKRLPTSAEWLAAALGTPDKTAGWSSDDCNVANNWQEEAGLTGLGKDCVSASGANDMIGNVWEWVQDSINEGTYKGQVLPLQGYVAGVDDYGMPSSTTPETSANYHGDYFWMKPLGVRGLMRGGYWNNQAEAGVNSVYAVFEPSFTGTGVGFRCVK